ncbi:MAG: SAM-dependent methyltransferase [Nocardioidaceae bacterium]
MTWRTAWDQALYQSDGFYRGEWPRQHFRTSPQVSVLFAAAIVALVRRLGLDAIVDYGAGSGELLGHISSLAPDLHLTGIELRARPPTLPAPVRWLPHLRAGDAEPTTLLVANELLDNVPCEVVELDTHGELRLVEVEPATGNERLGGPASADEVRWADEWWPTERAGQRVEVGLTRDDLWASLCAGDYGACIAVDYGHLREARPDWTTMSSYRHGRMMSVALDGRHDVTAHVAVDSVAARVGGRLSSQREMLRLLLDVDGRRPALELATADPAAYVRALSQATQLAELTAIPGLGAFYWLLSARSESSAGPVQEPHADMGEWLT